MAELSPIRLGYRLRPFTNTGVDYFGPMEIKIERRREKIYGVLTCMSVIPVYIALAHSLSTDSTQTFHCS